jgi:hypothetical protein
LTQKDFKNLYAFYYFFFLKASISNFSIWCGSSSNSEKTCQFVIPDVLIVQTPTKRFATSAYSNRLRTFLDNRRAKITNFRFRTRNDVIAWSIVLSPCSQWVRGIRQRPTCIEWLHLGGAWPRVHLTPTSSADSGHLSLTTSPHRKNRTHGFTDRTTGITLVLCKTRFHKKRPCPETLRTDQAWGEAPPRRTSWIEVLEGDRKVYMN